MPTIAVKADPRQLAEVDQLLAGVANGANRAYAAAINTTLKTGRSRLTKRIIQQLGGVKQKDLKDQITVRPASAGSGQAAAVLSGAIKISARPVPLYDYAPRPSMPGKTKAAGVSIRGVTGRQLIAHSFIARMKSGHIGIWKRVRGKRAIYELKGPTPAGTFEKAPGLAEEVLSNLGEDLAKNLDSKVRWLLQRRKGDS